MIITGMEHFQSVCKQKLVEKYNESGIVQLGMPKIDLSNVWLASISSL